MNRLCVLQLLKNHVLSQQSGTSRHNIVSLLALASAGLHSDVTALQKGRAGSTVAVAQPQEAGFVKRLLKRTGWLDHSRSRLRVSGYLLYENVADRVDYPRFFKEFDLADTFLSWFVITELHLWMLMVRTMAEGKEGVFVRNCMIRAMWDDATVRAKKLEEVNPAGVREQLNILSEEFQASLFGYDEGLLSDDKVLAGAIWRRFFQLSCNNPLYIESLVQFVRQQVKLLDVLPREEILLHPDINWISFQKPSLM